MYSYVRILAEGAAGLILLKRKIGKWDNMNLQEERKSERLIFWGKKICYMFGLWWISRKRFRTAQCFISRSALCNR